ncbi:MAG: ribulose-bisphosphate carboxylase large subunit family protein [Devosia sp.]|uniref:ribulose-bisphosphate carboxylase large subunit family protein n=1 Tax=Devosia sp. 66-22 TaxID=1895753 RepID=UPI0009278829|nr:ribulose-bisphosphate carboxylase large subunit family protein [Devosia sp. 66-22]MBN9348472.1 ribulose-bisphosphate carboxylase large subunit family protein [Devosia sp.]OJX47942.1 MAG: ribulose 1,5-bisphosphate carboxylase [Devosia sp. 66-22]
MTEIRARYLVETALNLEACAEAIAGEQSSGTFVAVPGEDAALRARARARVVAIEEIDGTDAPSLPGGRAMGGPVRRGYVEIAWPFANVGASLPNLMSTVAGNLFELREISGLKIMDIALPPPFFETHAGPAFGVAGTRRISGVERRPLIGTIVKPSVGLSIEATADLVSGLAEAGIDFIKDDELQGDSPSSPFADRVRAVMDVLRRHADRTGKRVLYAFNITGEVDEMRWRHDLVEREGGTCVMVSINSVGLAGVISLARHSRLIIHGHRNGWGALSRHPVLGWSYVAWQKFWRLAGVDHLHVNGLQNKFCESDESVLVSARACLTPMSPAKPAVAMPVFSSGQTVRQVADTWSQMGSSDLIFAAGGGVLGHPDGTRAGVEALQQAWDAAIAGVPVARHAAQHPPLARALAAFDGA